jgi:hypothetical protein
MHAIATANYLCCTVVVLLLMLSLLLLLLLLPLGSCSRQQEAAALTTCATAVDQPKCFFSSGQYSVRCEHETKRSVLVRSVRSGRA